MSPQVVAAIIAASVSFLTLIGTLAAQYFGRRATSRDTQKALEMQREQLNTTLAAQREQLDRTLAEQRTRTLNERFATAAGQLGSDKPAAVRLARVYAMAGLADDWQENRQTCVDVLCGYLRMPYEPDPGAEAAAKKRLDFEASREVRHTVIRVIAAHLQEDAAVSWQGLGFDFTGVVFDGGDFSSAEFPRRSGPLRPSPVLWRPGQLRPRCVLWRHDQLQRHRVLWRHGRLPRGRVLWRHGRLPPCPVLRRYGRLPPRPVLRRYGRLPLRRFCGARVDFGGAEFSGGTVDFRYARFRGGTVDFEWAMFSGSAVYFRKAEFSGGTVDFSDSYDWSFPPAFPWTDTPPSGVKLPKKEDQSQA